MAGYSNSTIVIILGADISCMPNRLRYTLGGVSDSFDHKALRPAARGLRGAVCPAAKQALNWPREGHTEQVQEKCG